MVKPSMPGIMMSSTINSGCSDLARARPSFPSKASMTECPSLTRRYFTRSTTSFSSSTIRTLPMKKAPLILSAPALRLDEIKLISVKVLKDDFQAPRPFLRRADENHAFLLEIFKSLLAVVGMKDEKHVVACLMSDGIAAALAVRPEKDKADVVLIFRPDHQPANPVF